MSGTEPEGIEAKAGAMGRKALLRLSASSTFLVVVPVATVSPGRPTRRIPFDENINDPNSAFYRDLGLLSQRPYKNPPGVTFKEEPLNDPKAARLFLAELLQYYILREVRILQHGTLEFGVTKFLGKPYAVANAVDVAPVPVPNGAPYPILKLFRALGENEFLNVYSYSTSTKDGVETPHWEQIERSYWYSKEHPFKMPKGTVISFSGNNKDPKREVIFQRPGFYRLKFSVVPLFGADSSLPKNFLTSWPGVDSYSCQISMEYKIQQRTDKTFSPDAYVHWAESLFRGMKQAMAP